MQRYNPLYKVVDTIIKEKLLGNFLHGFFENYASDEKLDPGHWFWDKEKSGGIFIEHGVHFFDMFSGWLGKGKVINAIQQDRQQPGKTITDRVEATVLYEHGTVHFYHGFNQLRILDRQEMRLQFEYGDITLYEWVPVKMKLTGLLRDSQIAHLQSITGECTITYDAALDGDNTVIGRSAVIDFDHKITVECGDAKYKQERYAQLLTSMLNDQWSWIKDRAHKRTINERNAVDSLVIAEKASLIAQNF